MSTQKKILEAVLESGGLKKLLSLYARFKRFFDVTELEEEILLFSYVLVIPIAGARLMDSSISGYLLSLFVPLLFILLIRGVRNAIKALGADHNKAESSETKTPQANSILLKEHVELHDQMCSQSGRLFLVIAMQIMVVFYSVLVRVMSVNPNWDLLVIALFFTIVAYGFFVGRSQILRVIIASYIAMLTADGIAGLVLRYSLHDTVINRYFSISPTIFLLSLKILLFIFTIVLISSRGRFVIIMDHSGSITMNAILNFTYGILSAGLITSTILIYTSGSSLVQETGVVINEAVLAMYRDSMMVQTMINNYNIWFSLPAITFVISSFLGEED